MSESLADALRDLRTQARLSQRELAKIAGVGKNTVTGIEGGASGTKPETLELLAVGLATDGSGRLHAELVAGYYDRLARGAGYVKETGAFVPNPEATRDAVRSALIESVGEDAAVELLAAADEGGLGQEGKETLARLVRMMRQAKPKA